MKTYIHARLARHDYLAIEALKKETGQSASQLVRRGLRLVLNEVGGGRSALATAGRSAGKFKKGPKDLSTNEKRLRGFGE